MNKKYILKWIGNIITVLALIFIVVAFSKMSIDFKRIFNLQNIMKIIGLSILYSISVFISSYVWKSILSIFSTVPFSYTTVMPIYTKSNLGKYIPGNIMQYANRNIFGESLGISQKNLLFSSVIEIGIIVFTAIFWSLLLMRESFINLIMKYVPKRDFSFYIAISICITLSFIIIFLFLIKKRNTHKFIQSIQLKNTLIVAIKAFVMVSLTFIVSIIIFFTILQIYGGTTKNDIIYISGSYIVAWTIGFIIPGSPGGIGVREAALTFLLSDIIPIDILLLSVVVQRIVSITGDIISFLFTCAYTTLIKKG